MLRTGMILFVFGLPSLVVARYLDHRDVNAHFLDCYDYIIVGGGVSGMVVGNRLTENQDVLESGNLDQNEDFIMYPIEDGNGLGTSYDWNLWTVPQEHLDGLSRPYDMGRGIGGGSLINGMCWTRGGKADYDAWVTLGNAGWGWDDLLPYFIKTENYDANIGTDNRHALYIQPNMSNHGSHGNVHVSYPRYFYNQSKLFLEGLKELGIPILTDSGNGAAVGGMVIPNSLNPNSQTRSSARTGYFDGFADRPNFHVATGQLVVRLITGTSTHNNTSSVRTGVQIIGVEVITNGSLDIHVIKCSSEVILAAGSVHTPQILELSGIGPSRILENLGIPVKVDLPGVGNNFQDHPYIGVIYYVSNSSYLTTGRIENDPNLLNRTWQEYYVNRTGPWTAGAINTVAFPSLPSISRNWTNMMVDALNQPTTRFLAPDLDETVVLGYKAQKAVLVELLSSLDVGGLEILSDNVGLLAVSAMHPFSRGSVHVHSTNPLLQPLIDPRYCSNPLDCQVLVEGLLFNNRLLKTNAIGLLGQIPYGPFKEDATPETLMPAIRSGIRTEFHGSGTTSMLPLELGGVVDTHLRVYGTMNLRVVDAGIMPLVPAAHLQGPVYAIAEKAADIIKADNLLPTPRNCGTNQVSDAPGDDVPAASLNAVKPTTSGNYPQSMDYLNSSAILSNTVSGAVSATPSFVFNGNKTNLSHSSSVETSPGKSYVIAAAAALLLSPTHSIPRSEPSVDRFTSSNILEYDDGLSNHY